MPTLPPFDWEVLQASMGVLSFPNGSICDEIKAAFRAFFWYYREFMDAIKGVLVYVGRPRSEMLGGDGSRAYTAPNGSPQAKMSDAGHQGSRERGRPRSCRPSVRLARTTDACSYRRRPTL